MSTPLVQHQTEIQDNRTAWEKKPVLRAIYAEFHRRIAAQVRRDVPGRIVEIGSGNGQLKAHLPEVVSTDLFPNPWLDLVCDGYELPFKTGTLSNLVLFDVFHHIEAPRVFLNEARRALAPGGRVIVFDPYISLCSWPAYGVFHHEPVAWRAGINVGEKFPSPRPYYAAQGNATRLFFKGELPELLSDWKLKHAEAFACFSYLLSGGFSKPALYPAATLPLLQGFDSLASAMPRLFGGRCLAVLEK